MTLDMECPKCRHLFPVTEARHPVGVECPECGSDLTAEFRRLPAPAPGEPPYEVVVKAGKPPGATDAPAGARRLPLDDDDDPKRKGGGLAIVVVSGLSALLVATGTLGGIGYYLFTNIDIEETASTNGSRRGNTTNSNIHTSPNSLTNPGNRPSTVNNQPFNPGTNFPAPNFPTPNFPAPNFPTPNFPKTNVPKPGIPNPTPNIPPPPPKKVDQFDLKPVSGVPHPILPPTLPASPTVIDLGGRAGATAIGGGGRYVVIHFPDRGMLSLFDASEGKMRTGVAAERGDVKVAAGISWVVTFSDEGKRFRVYTLPNLERKADSTIDLFAGVTSMAMGCRTNGPLLVSNPFGDLVLLNVSDSGLKEVEGARKKPGTFPRHMRALPDGTAFVSYDVQSKQSRILTESNREWKVVNLPGPVTSPGHDGNFYGDGAVYDRDGVEKNVGGAGAGSGTWYVPAASDERYFLKVAPTSVPAKPRNKQTLTVTVHAAGKAATPVDGTPVLANVSDFDGMCDVFRGGLRVPADQHFYLFPQAKLLAVLSGDRAKLVLRKYDLK